jgi:hypothetical protein
MQYSAGGPFVISVSGKGLCITNAGISLLDKMNIEHKGSKVTAEFFESRR